MLRRVKGGSNCEGLNSRRVNGGGFYDRLNRGNASRVKMRYPEAHGRNCICIGIEEVWYLALRRRNRQMAALPTLKKYSLKLWSTLGSD